MNILYVNHYAGSLKLGMEFRPYYMSRDWQKAGHKVLIVASSESHVRASRPDVQTNFKNEVIDGVSYLWCKTPKYNGNGVGRVINIFAFLFRLLQKTPYFVKNFKPDAVIASSTYPLDIFPSWLIARLSGARLIYEVHDLWPLSPMEIGGMSKYHPFIMLLQLAENFGYRHADKVVSMLPNALDHMLSHGMKRSKHVYIPNGIDLNEWEISGEVPQTLLEKINRDKTEGRFTLAYLGAHGVANALENLLEAANILGQEKISIYLVGSGPEREKLIALAHAQGLSNVQFIEAVPKTSIPSITGMFDGLYIGLKNQSLFRFGISPNKIMDYMAARKPIISAIKAGNDPVTEADCGFSIEPENPRVLADAILKLSNTHESERIQMGLRGRAFVEKNHDYRELSSRLAKVLAPES